MSRVDPRAPVIVGSGQASGRDDDEPQSPLELMRTAASAALEGCGAADPGRLVESVAITDCLSWPVPDPGRALAEALGISPAETVKSITGGTSPIDLLRDAARRIHAGELEVALLAGGEATRSLARGRFDGNPIQPDGTEPTRVVGVTREQGHAAEEAAGLYLPVAYYPLFEHALRAARGDGIEAHNKRIARLWERLAAVARDNPHAWVREAPDAAAIATASERNRRVCDPYTKLMTANIHVDQGAALLVMSAAAAEAAGVPRERWTFVAATAAAHDHWFTVERDDLHRSPAIAACARAAFAHSAVGVDDLSLIDIYSCFPSAVQIAAAEIGLDAENDPRPPSVTGGLTFAGGPASNYAMHSLAALAGGLREQRSGLGLATGVGWFMTKHALALLSSEPPPQPFADLEPQAEVDALPARAAANGPAATAPIETYTVLYGRDGEPTSAIVSCLLADGSRALAASDEAATVAAMLERDPLGDEAALDGAARFVLG